MLGTDITIAQRASTPSQHTSGNLATTTRTQLLRKTTKCQSVFYMTLKQAVAYTSMYVCIGSYLACCWPPTNLPLTQVKSKGPARSERLRDMSTTFLVSLTTNSNIHT